VRDVFFSAGYGLRLICGYENHGFQPKIFEYGLAQNFI
jgi:hypothetical protein